MMKKMRLFSTMLAVLFVLAMMPCTGAASEEWGADFEDGLPAASMVSPTNNTQLEVVPNPDGSGGSVCKAVCTIQAGTSMNLDIKGFPLQNTGIWVLDTDIYLPSDFDSEKFVNMWPAYNGPNDSYSTKPNMRLTGGTATTGINVPDFPKGEWQTARYIFDYTVSGKLTITYGLVKDGTFMRLARSVETGTAYLNGIQNFRFQIASCPAGVTYYIDNIRYYQQSARPEGISTKAETHYAENFNHGTVYALSSESTSTTDAPTAAYSNLTLRHNRAAAAVGTSQATANTATLSGKKCLQVTVESTAHNFTRLDTNPVFDLYTTGVQVAEVDLYIPADQIDTGSNNQITIFSLGSTSALAYPRVRLRGTGDSRENPTAAGDYAYKENLPKDAWFTVRIVLDYTNSEHAVEIEKADGTVISRATGEIPSTIANGLGGIRIDAGEQKTFYVGGIRYYEDECMPVVEEFEDGVADEVTITKENYHYSKATTRADRKCWFMVADGSSFVSTNPSSWSLSTNDMPIGICSGITTASVDISFTDTHPPRGNETLQVYAETYDAETKQKVQFGDAIRIDGASKLWSGDATIPSDALTAPAGAWFTLRITYNHESGICRYDMIKDDGTVVLLGRSAVSEDDRARLAVYGVSGMTLQYNRKANAPSNTTWYIDNVKLSNIVLENVALTEDSTNWNVDIIYIAKGNVKISTMLVAQYDADQNLVELTVSYPEFSADTNALNQTIPKAEKAVTAKLMLWEDMGSLTPMIPAK